MHTHLFLVAYRTLPMVALHWTQPQDYELASVPCVSMQWNAAHQSSWVDCQPRSNSELNLCSVTVHEISQMVKSASCIKIPLLGSPRADRSLTNKVE